MAKKRRRKKVTPEQKLRASYKKIDEIFEKKININLSVKSTKNKKHEGKGNTITSNKKYASQVKSLMKELDVNDLKDIDSDKIKSYVHSEIDNYRNGGDYLAANRLNDRISALNALMQGVQETNIIGRNAKKEMNFGNIQDYRDLVTANKVFRVDGISSWKVGSNREMRTVKDRLDKKFQETNDLLDKITRDYVRFSQITGSRANNGLATREKDIQVNKDGTANVEHYKDKGSMTRKMKVYDKKSVEFLKELKENSNRGKLFQAYKEDNKPMSNNSLQKRIRERLTEVTSDLTSTKEFSSTNSDTTFKVEQRITLHSVRKNFATTRVIELYEYFKRSPKETKQRIQEVIDEMSLTQPKVRQKYDQLVKKQNQRNDYKKVDMLSVEETSLYLVSCELGHFRTDVIKSSYIDHDSSREVKRKYKN